MRWITSLFIIGTTTLLASGCGSKEFKEFTAPDGSCKVMIPGGNPKSKTQEVAGVTKNMFLYEEKNGGYWLAYSDRSGAAESDAKILDDFRQSTLSSLNATLTSESKISLGEKKYSGREITANLPNDRGVVRARVFLANRRLYEMMIMGTSSWANSADATRFLDSLVLLNK